MTISSTKTRIAVLVLVILGLLGAVGTTLYRIREDGQESARLLGEVDSVAGERATAELIKDIRVDAEAEINYFESLALMDTGIVSVIESIEDAGRLLGLSTKTLSVEKVPESDGSKIQKVTLVVETKGTWSGVFSYLKALESLPQRVSISGIEMSKELDGWHSSITLSLFAFE